MVYTRCTHVALTVKLGGEKAHQRTRNAAVEKRHDGALSAIISRRRKGAGE